MIINLELLQIAIAYIFILLILLVLRLRGIPREKEIIIPSIRMTLQLVITGFVLMYLFENINPFFTIIAIVIMEVFAVFNIYKRVGLDLSKKLKNIVAFSMIIGTTICLLFFVFAVINLSPWYEPRYFIPLAGMFIGNSMTGISLGLKTLVSSMNDKKPLIEAALMLGATPKMASKEVVEQAFDSAILPTINSMVGMGIVFLPGMMTGQILSGISPFTAIEYQIVIMLGILGSVSLSVILLVQLGYKTFFNEQKQLNI
jgi:putative ABC transport system permease protein